MRILLTGGSGLLGTYLALTKPKSAELFLTSRRANRIPRTWPVKVLELDVTKPDDVERVMKNVRPSAVIHAASMGNVDECQRQPELAHRVNVEGTAHMLDASETVGATFLLPSTNVVFDGRHPPYGEDAEPHPLNVYGETKFAAERLVQASQQPWLIVRLMTMYGWTLPDIRPNPVTWLLPRLKGGEPTQLVDDRFFNPPYALDVAEAIWNLLAEKSTGVYHLAGPKRTNRFDWGRVTAEVFGFRPSSLVPVSSATFPSLAPRPFDITYSYLRAKKDIGYHPRPLRQGLIHMRDHRFGLA